MQLIDAMYNDVQHVKISDNIMTSVFLKVRTLWRYAYVMLLDLLMI